MSDHLEHFCSSCDSKLYIKTDNVHTCMNKGCIFYDKNIVIGKEDFIKFDHDKLMYSLIDPKFIEGLAAILTMGAKKYSPNNWKKCDDQSRYYDALFRHLYAYMQGEKIDKESGLSHLYHAGCNLMFMAHFDE